MRNATISQQFAVRLMQFESISDRQPKAEVQIDQIIFMHSRNSLLEVTH